MFSKTYTIERWDGVTYFWQDLKKVIKEFGAWKFLKQFGTEPDFGLRQVSGWAAYPIDSYTTVKSNQYSEFKIIVKHQFLIKNSKGLILDPWMILVNYHRDISTIHFMKNDSKASRGTSHRRKFRRQYYHSQEKVHQSLKAKYNVKEDDEPGIRNKCRIFVNKWDPEFHRSKPIRSWKSQSKRNKQYKGA